MMRDKINGRLIGLIAAMGAGVRRRASRMADTARIGPILVTGLLGASNTFSAERIALMTPGAGSAVSAPRNRTERTASW